MLTCSEHDSNIKKHGSDSLQSTKYNVHLNKKNESDETGVKTSINCKIFNQ